MFASIGRPELIDDPRYRTNAERVKHAAELDAIIGAFIAERTQAENVAFFEKAEVTIGPIYDISQILEDPHFIEREVIADYPDADMDAFPMHHVVPRLPARRARSARRRRSSASTTASCCAEVGIDDAAYAKLTGHGRCMRARAARPQKTLLGLLAGSAELGVANHAGGEPAPRMRAHDFIVQFHAGSR